MSVGKKGINDICWMCMLETIYLALNIYKDLLNHWL